MQEIKGKQKQKLLYANKLVNSSITPVECYVCGKGLEDGYSVTAKKLHGEIVLFCDVHYSLQ